MYQIKIFTGPTPLEVEDGVNRWLRQRSEVSHVRFTQAASTDVVQVSSTNGVQRFTLILMYEIRENGYANLAPAAVSSHSGF